MSGSGRKRAVYMRSNSMMTKQIPNDGTVRIIQGERWGILPSLSILKLSTDHSLVGNASEAVL
jgi:hypothetical protein